LTPPGRLGARLRTPGVLPCGLVPFRPSVPPQHARVICRADVNFV